MSDELRVAGRAEYRFAGDERPGAGAGMATGHRTPTTILALFLVSALPLIGQQTTPPPPLPAKPIAWPKVTERNLENGLTVVLVPLSNVPKVTADLTFLAGRGTGWREHPGLAQLAARVANEGTATRSSKQVKEELRSIGGSLTVTTDADTTTISANALSEFAPHLLELISDVAQHPAYSKAEVDLGRANMKAEIEEERSNPDFLADEQLQKAIFGSTAYGFVVAGPKAIDAITREQLVSFASAHYLPNGAHLVVAGDFETEPMFRQVQKAFGSWKSGTLPAEGTLTVPKREKRQIYFVDRPGSVQSTILMGALAGPRKAADYLALRTANMVCGGAFYSRLTRNLREAKGYTYTPFSTADMRRRSGLFEAGASVRNEVTGPALLEMLYELDRMRITPVTAEELAAAKTYSVGSMELELETQAGLAQRVSTLYIYDLPRDFLQTFREKIDALTVADLQKAAARYFDTYRGAIVIVGDYAKVKDQVTPFGDVTLVK
jgi:zinc protease